MQALRTHPDKGGDPEDFLRVMNSFEVLSDSARRGAYDADLDRRRCKDGQSLSSAAGQQAAPAGDAETDSTKAVRGQARVAHLKLMLAREASWAERLSQMSCAVLDVLSTMLRQERPKKRRRDLDTTEFPREICAPSGLPPGWKCMEHVYLSGRCKGLTYTRFTSPWGKPNFQSVLGCVKADCERRGVDSAGALQALHEMRRPIAPTSGRADKTKAHMPQRCIYSTGREGEQRYWVNCNWKSFRVFTKRTTSLMQAVDWHIALNEAKDAAERRHRDRADFTPMTQDELIRLLEAEPDIQLSYIANFAYGTSRNIFTPTTSSLEFAVMAYKKFQKLLRQPNLPMQRINEQRAKLCEEHSKRAGRIAAIAARLDLAVAEERARRGMQLPLHGPAPVAALPPPAPPSPRRGPMPAGPGPRDRRSGAQQAEPRADDPEMVRAALDLVGALGFESPAAVSGLATRLRARGDSGSGDRRARLRHLAAAILQDPGDAAGDGAARESSPRSRPRRSRAAPATPAMAALPADGERMSPFGRAWGLALSPPASAVQLAVKASVASVGSPGSEMAMLALGPGAVEAALPLRTALPPRAAPAAAESWIAQLPPDVVPLCAVAFDDLDRLRAASPVARVAADRELAQRCKAFRYGPGLLEPAPVRTRRGRALQRHDAAWRDATRLASFLARPGIAPFVESIDLCQSPMSMLETVPLQASLSCLSNLKDVVVPMHGWSTPTERKRFLRMLPSGTWFRCMDAHGSVCMEGVSGGGGSTRRASGRT